MKGLLIKDLYMARKYFKSYILLSVIFLASAMVSDNLFFLFYPCLLCSMIPVNLLAYDERGKWDVYAGTLPVSRAQIVSAKYLMGLIAQSLVLLCVGLTQLVRMKLNGDFDLAEYGSILGILLSLCFLTIAIPMPFMFKLGVEKGRMAYYVMVGVACGGSYLASSFVSEVNSAGLSVPVLCLAAIGFYGLSWYLSIRLYEKKEIT